jgi:hypothetical protein
MVRPFARPVAGFGMVDHLGFFELSADGVYVIEMAPANGRLGGPIEVFRQSLGTAASTGRGITSATADALSNGTLLMGEWAEVSRSALSTALSEYRSQFGGRPYNPVHNNSNEFVNFVFKRIGADPRVPGAVPPARLY